MRETRLLDLVETSAAVSATAGRLEKTARLAELLARLGREEISIVTSFVTGTTRQGRVGVGPASVRAAAAVAPAAAATLSLRDVDETLSRVAGAAGAGSAAEKTTLLAGLFARATPPEQAFLARLLYGELRQGALEGVFTEAVARAAKTSVASVRRAAMLSGDLALTARTALLEGEPGLSRISIQVLHPVQPMLAGSADDVGEALEALGEAALEFKLDGVRIQVHKSGDEVMVFSRHLREVTAAVPEVVELARVLPAREFVLDGEVLALRDDGTPHPFQVTMRRFGRKLELDRLRVELPLTPFFFDAIYHDGTALVDEPGKRRFGVLEAIIPPAFIVPHAVAARPEVAERFFREALERGHEGIMAKALDAPYVAGSRGAAWLKVKAAQTLDLVVLAAEWGSGRRQGWLSNLHLGARDPERGGFVMLGKTFKGLTDELLTWQTRELLAREIARDADVVYVRPELVVEIAFNEVQASPRYPGGLTLRFARVRRYRPDKSPDQADTIANVRNLFLRAQKDV